MLSVADVLALASVGRGQPEVLAGEQSLGSPVRWVHVSDVPEVAGLLDGGELLLTTGGFLRLPVVEALAELDRVVAGGAAGIVVELDPRLGPLPDELVQRARLLHVPLVVLHHSVRFVEITEEVHRRLVSRQLDQVTFAAEVHATFTALGLQRADRGTILDAAARMLSSPVVLEDQRRRVLGSATVGADTGELLEDWERRSRLATWQTGTSRGGPEEWLTTTVGVQGRVWARLVAPAPGDAERGAVVLERAVQALELGRMIARDDAATELRLHGSLVSDLLADRLADERQATARLRAVGLRPATSYRGLVVTWTTDDSAVEATGLVRRLLAAARLEALVAVLDDQHVGVLLTSGRIPPRLDGEARQASYLLAAGHEVGQLTEVAGSLQAARRLAQVAGALPGPRAGLVEHGDVRLHGLLVSLADSDALTRFVEAELGRVLEHDARHGTDLLGLLRAYLDAGGAMTAMSRSTHRNRSSLYPALERLAEVVGHPLDTVDSRTSLAVALLAHDLGAPTG